MAALGPLVERLGLTTKGVTFSPAAAVEGFRALEQRTGTRLANLAAEHEGKRISFADTQARPTPVITSPEWSGSETGGRRYSPFVINVERSKPWHTLTGRQHFFLDHDWMAELGEQLPVFRPPLDMHAMFDEPRIVFGILVPEAATSAAGISEHAYHVVAVALGSVSGFMTVAGLAILIYRRRVTGPVFSATTRNDKAMYVLLTATIVAGLSTTVLGNLSATTHTTTA